MKSTRLGGGFSVFYGCDGCKESYMDLPAIMISVYVCKSHLLLPAALMLCTLQNALGMNTAHPNEFYETIVSCR